VRQPCLVYALTTHQEFGIWGGWDENERRLLRRQWRETRGAAGEEPPQP
jgi:WhiB family redox-sensing transcriptional regulator